MKLYRQKKSKYWTFDHTFPDGNRIRQSTKRTDKTVARLYAQTIINDYDKKKRLIPNKGRFFAEYLLYARPRKNPKTIRYEQTVWDKFTAFLHTDDPWTASIQQIDGYFTNLISEDKLRPATVNGHRRILRMLFNKAIRWKYAFENPITQVEIIRFEPEPPRFLTQEELNKFFASTRLRFPELISLFSFYFLTGIRRSEAFNLTWQDVDFDRKIITVKKTKGKRPRFVPITPMAENILRINKSNATPFSEDLNREMSSGFRPLNIISKMAEIEPVTLHDLRRSFATYMAEQVSEKILQQLLGHDNYSVTDVFYIGHNSAELLKKMSVLDDKLREALDYRGMTQIKSMT